MSRLPFIPSAYTGRSKAQETQRFVNLFPELTNAPGSTSIAALVGTPGLRLFSNGIAPPVRGMIAGPDGLLYAVESNRLVSVAADGSVTALLGTLQTAAGRVSMKHNGLLFNGIGGNQIAIADGTATYIYNVATGVFSTVAQPFKHLEFIDSYFIGVDGSMNAYASDIYNGLSWPGLATTPVQAAPDNISNLINLHQQLLFIKEYTSEVYYNNGTAASVGFPYSRMSGAVIDYGTLAPWTVARGGNSVLFLAWERDDNDNPCFAGVVMLNGYTPVPVSPQSVTWQIGQSTDLTQCFAYCYSDEGHTFYVLANPVDNWTWCYDLTTQMWHERSSNVASTAAVGRHLSNTCVKVYGMHIVGDYMSGRLYEMSTRFFTDGGLPITSQQITQRLTDGDSRDDIFIGELQALVESGVGLDGPATPAVAVATVSDGSVTAVTVVYGGADYIDLRDVYETVYNSDGTPVQWEDGQYVTALVVPAQVVIRSRDGNGSGATAVAHLAYGSVASITVTDGGSGYTTPPEVVVLGMPVRPFAALAVSRDGGNTWSGEYPRSMGNTGEYRKRLRWSSLGRARDRVFRLRVSSPCKRILLGYIVEPT